MRRRALTVVLALAVASLAAGAGPHVTAADEVDRTRAAALDAARHYRVTLERVLEFREPDLRRAEERLAKRSELLELGIVSRKEVADAERQRDEAQARLEDTRRQLTNVDAMIAELNAATELARLPGLRPGEYRELPTLIRFNGPSPFSPAALGPVQRFFADRFGRPLPVSALGQTVVHDRLGYDHRQAVDVAVHPDSDEGRALIEYLRRAGIPFLAFRHAVSGAATAAHVHIGRPSERLSAVR
jgi:hypothetical protein